MLTFLALLVAGGLLVARHLQQRATHRAEADLQTIFETAPIGNVVLDAADRIVAVNAAFARIVGRRAQDIIGRTITQLLHADDVALLRVSFTELHHDVSGTLETELRFVHAVRDEPVMAALHAAVLERADGRAQRTLVQVLDITERNRAQVHLQHLADHDGLTGLLNRRRFEQELQRHVAHATRYGGEGAAILLDVDNFKSVNDTHGHPAGDRLIVAVGEILRGRLRTTDMLARLGGDEFAILLPKADRHGAEAVAHSLVETIREQATLDDGTQRRPIKISVGVVMLDTHADPTPEGIIGAADLAMYEAKAAGGDGFAFFAPPTEVRVARAPTLVA